MDRVFFEQLRLPDARYNLDVGSSVPGTQASKMIDGLEDVLSKESPDIVLVEGDTNSVLAGAYAAQRLGIKVGHVEAGLRSYDRSMPEEMNRVLTDHCSDYLFAPTENSRRILLDEGFPAEKIFVTGNTVVDAIFQNLGLAKKRMDVLQGLGLESEDYFLATLHRQENVDDEERLRGILNGLQNVAKELEHEVLCPVHPRTRKNMEKLGIDSGCVRMVEPLDYLSFLRLESEAKLILTDSGGIQEEACILGVPCVTLRDNTERPETLEVGSNVLAGASPERIVEKAKQMIGKDRNWQNPFGDGNAAVKIMDVLRQKL
jgi:UDP-N-acetylglucosamine 2-epimerase (non-hydrolysing)